MGKTYIKYLASFFILFQVLMPFKTHSQSIEKKASITGFVQVIEDSTNLFIFAPKLIEHDPLSLPGAVVIVMDQDSSIIAGTSTSQDSARYIITGLNPGNYIIEVTHIAYEPETVNIQLSKGEKLNKDFQLGHIYDPEELPFGAKEAKKDIEKGLVEFKDNSITIWEIFDREALKRLKAREAEIRKKYGFSTKKVTTNYKELNPSQRSKLGQAIIRYNQEVEKYLEKINGEDWRERYEKDFEKAWNEIIR
ncbi:MAG TPA: carboxypeptidase-like regulatory domain-containing protein [Gracilimonas sp.]|uniref:carboxypeptidase-like regulatory domain-containing protein n=1 Tax=Gracilimonas sp. TaxID=1974203 RepID=UPI002DA93372|nr:carboxypeptidase-like regulatory domain-containing protein [Gracilimonas sp.]